jgi:hypothetical protein
VPFGIQNQGSEQEENELAAPGTTSAGIEIVSKNEDEGNDVSGIEEKVNLGYECDGGMQDENKCGRLQNLDQLAQGKNNNASNCGSKLMNRGEGMKGSEEICGGKGGAQLLDMGWMKNG